MRIHVTNECAKDGLCKKSKRNVQMKKYNLLQLSFVILLISFYHSVFAAGPAIDIPQSNIQIDEIVSIKDTIPLNDRFDDFVTNNSYNPFDLQDPSEIKQEVIYDPESGLYVITEKIGDDFYRAPTYMTFQEYLDWQGKQQERDYFNQLAGIEASNRSKSGIIDPLAKIDIKKKLIDRLFGGNEITIEPQGNVDLTFGGDYQKIENPNIPRRNQITGGPDFNMNIKTNIQGKIGDKMDLGFNFDTQSTFNFDNKLKLEYDSEKWTEDDILKKIEVGDISMPLRSQLIQGNQSLFGVKTMLQFGHLKITALAAEQQSSRDELQIESGGTIQEFEVYPDEYDENRHFFLSHFNRETYEENLEDLPFIKTPFRIVNLQVWITNDREETERLRDIAALADLGVGEDQYLTNPSAVTVNPPSSEFFDFRQENVLNDNERNSLYDLIEGEDNARVILNTATTLQSKFGLEQSKDFEILKARRLTNNEYTFHPELGFLSLNVRLRPNQVLAVSYQYTYTYNGDEIYQVGELADEVTTQDSSKVIYTKLLKSSVQNVSEPNWDLMMKNVYPVGAAGVDPQTFKFDIFFEDNTDGSLKRYIPIKPIDQFPLLNVFGLDKLNSQGDPQEDGIFDFVPGVTIIPKSGAIIFPVLEPFGSSLTDLIPDPDIADSLAYNELYDLPIIAAREELNKNRFVLRGEYKSAISSEISLGAFNIPPGSVTVRAGSKVLTPNVDYEIDYGIGRIRILNDSYLQQGVPIRVSFENNSFFNLQRKYLLGTRLDYALNEKLSLGATYMHLFERPYTEKVNLGDDPINNKIYGFDLNYNDELPWLTRTLDKLPFYSTSSPSSITSEFEVAALRPGYSRAITNDSEDGKSIIMVDDFEGSASGIPLGGLNFNDWILSSTPSTYPEHQNANDLSYGYNRARLNWYVLETEFLNQQDRQNSYTRLVNRTELFPNITQLQSQIPFIRTFDLSFYPDERGPYNFDPPGGEQGVSSGSYWDNNTDKMMLNDPESRWGGVMRFLNNNDFQQLNVEYIEFWMMNPFLDYADGTSHDEGEEGFIHFNLGNVSEDILKDNLQFYENGLTFDETEPLPVQESTWGNVPLLQPKTLNFDLNNAQAQDLGLDGLSDAEENEKFDQYIEAVLADNPAAEIKIDPSGDNYVAFTDDSLYVFEEQSALERVRLFNNSQGNAPERNPERFQRSKYTPDIEDLNKNRSLDQGENYYDYVIKLVNKNGEIDTSQTDYIREFVDIGEGGRERWYRFQIPINDPDNTIGTIEGFRSIQFLRMYMNGFKSRKTFRLANFELIRNQWRRLETACSNGPNPVEFAIDAVSIEENAQKTPFNYVLPPGIQRQQVLVNNVNVLQNEKSLALQFCDLPPTILTDEPVPKNCEPTVYKLTRLDMRLFEKLQLFFHGESFRDYAPGDLKVFIRVGRDFTENYYEYEIPLTLSDRNAGIAEPFNVWPEANKMDIDLKALAELKLDRNIQNFSAKQVYRVPDPNDPENIISIIGNPSLGYIKGIQVGVRNYTKNPACGEVWVNELRLVGLEEKGGVASIGRVDVQMADLGTVAASGSYSSIGFGSLDQKLAERSQEEVLEYNLATTLQLNKLLPGKLPISLPLYAQYSNTIKTPRYDPYDLDIEVKDKVEAFPAEAAEIRERAIDRTSISTVNLTNVRVEKKKGKKKPMPWDISNVSTSYSFTRTDHSDPIIEKDVTDNHLAAVDYAFNRQVKYWEPFKSVKSKVFSPLKIVNFNFFPDAFSVKNEVRRFKNVRTYRLPEDFDYTFYDQRFNWDRRYNLQWNFTKGLNFNFNANNKSIVDELRVVGVAGFSRVENERGEVVGTPEDIGLRERRDYIYDNLQNGGRSKDYDHNFTLQYTLPTRNIKFLNWTSVRASYGADYIWDGASLNIDSLGNVISNTQQRQLTATFNFDKLYSKSKYLDKIEKGNKKRTRGSRSSRSGGRSKGSSPNKKDDEKKKERNVTLIERAIIRPLLSLRTARLTYRENLGTVIPGIVRTSKYLGLDSQFDAPGWEFIGGLQPNINPTNPNNWLYRGAQQGWFTESQFLNQQVLQNQNQNLELKLDFEIYKDVDLEVNFKKTFTENHSEEFKQLDNTYQQLILRDMGSFEVSYFAMNTLWNDDYNGLFTQFENNRQTISNRLQQRAAEEAASLGVSYEMGDHPEDVGYAAGYGRQSTDVLIPAFLATYRGESPNDVDLFIGDRIKRLDYIPAPNWTFTYNGLSKLKWFSDIFSNVSLKHGYNSTLRITSFNSDPNFNALNPFDEIQTQSSNYYTRFDIPQMIISEDFVPVIGITVRTKNDLNFNAEYRKSRNLAMDFYAKELVENNSEEFVVGGGYVFKDVNIAFLTGKKSTQKGKKKKKPAGKAKSGGIGKVTNTKGNNLTLNADFSYRNDIVFNHTLDISGPAQATRGVESWTFNPSIEYDVNDNVGLRMFFDYSRSIPATTNSYPITNIQGGITVRLNLAAR